MPTHQYPRNQATQTTPIKGKYEACGYNIRKHPLVESNEIPQELAEILVDIPEVYRLKKNRSKCKLARILTSEEAMEERRADDRGKAALEDEKQRRRDAVEERNKTKTGQT